MKRFGQLLLGGVAGILLLKLLAALVLPLVGIVLGFLALVVKLALIAAVLCVILAIFRGRRRAGQEA